MKSFKTFGCMTISLSIILTGTATYQFKHDQDKILRYNSEPLIHLQHLFQPSFLFSARRKPLELNKKKIVNGVTTQEIIANIPGIDERKREEITHKATELLRSYNNSAKPVTNAFISRKIARKYGIPLDKLKYPIKEQIQGERGHIGGGHIRFPCRRITIIGKQRITLKLVKLPKDKVNIPWTFYPDITNLYTFLTTIKTHVIHTFAADVKFAMKSIDDINSELGSVIIQFESDEKKANYLLDIIIKLKDSKSDDGDILVGQIEYEDGTILVTKNMNKNSFAVLLRTKKGNWKKLSANKQNERMKEMKEKFEHESHLTTNYRSAHMVPSKRETRSSESSSSSESSGSEDSSDAPINIHVK